MSEEPFDPGTYWTKRLQEQPGLKATGHVSYSEGYNDWLYRRKALVLGRALKGVPAGARVFDVGSGRGWVLRQLIDHGLKPDGCDIAAPQVEDLKRDFPESQVWVADLSVDTLDVADGTYDVVTLIDVIYHLVAPGAAEHAIDELVRILKPGGRLIVTDTFGPADEVPAVHVRFRGRPFWAAQAARLGLAPVTDLSLFRWLSRPKVQRRLMVPDRVRGAVQFALEDVASRTSMLRMVTYRKG